MPEILYQVHVWRLCWITPPVNAWTDKKCLSCTRSVFRVVILHKTMATWWWKIFLYKRRSSISQLPLYLEYVNLGCSFSAYPTPNMNFCGMFWTRFRMRLLSFLSVACSPAELCQLDQDQDTMENIGDDSAEGRRYRESLRWEEIKIKQTQYFLWMKGCGTVLIITLRSGMKLGL